jgi:raffinose/stachyose/melibiose transport system substrate-binding protein
MTHVRRPLLALICLTALVAIVLASSATARSGHHAGKITITVWDTETDPGPAREMKILISQFEKAHPNVTVKHVSKSFDDYVSTIKLAASSNHAPDLFEGNEGYQIDQPLVQAKLIIPLDTYAKRYGWNKRFGSAATIADLHWSTDGKTWGTGPLWGIPHKAEVVGAFYNKKTLAKLGLRVPTTFAAFQHTLAAAAAQHVPPIMVGNLDRWPMGHVFMVLQSHFEQPGKIAAWTYGHPGATFDTAGTRQAATVLQQWAKAGYFESGFNGVSQTNAAARFAKGEGLYFITGPWENATFADPMGNNVGFFTLPPGSSRTTGAVSLPWHISSKSPNQDTAAALLDFLTNDHAAGVIARSGDLPAAPAPASALKKGSSLAAIVAAWHAKSASGGLTPYLDWATATMGDTLFGGLQELTASKTSPSDFTKKVQADWNKSHG